MNGGVSVWAISPEERQKHDQKFDTLAPSMGYVSGEQARKFLLQSGLPASVLAEIWALADMNKDGKMDRLEFSIAMKLIKLKLQGTPLPSALPIIMKQPPVQAPNIGTAYGVSMMPGSNLSMLTPMSLATPGLPPMMGLTPLVPTATGLTPMAPPSMAMMPNGTLGILQPLPGGGLAPGLPRSSSPYSSSSLGLSGMNKASSLMDLGSIGSGPSSPALLSPALMAPSDWAVPHASRLKYRQQFNSLDKHMTGFLTGQQVRAAMATTMLTQIQLASIWTLADVDKDGKLKAEEFILAMHLVDVAKCGQPLPVTLPPELVPPSMKSSVNGSSASVYAALTDDLDLEPPQKTRPNMSFEDKFKANLERGNAELEKRRATLQEAERRERERRQQKEREERERREKEEREAEERRRREEEKRMERQREMERQKEEERQREIERKEAAQRELERQRKEEQERRRQGELLIQKEQQQSDISKLKAKKRSLELELEAVGNKHRQISDRLRDCQNRKKLHKTELDLTNQRRDTKQQDINTLQKQLQEFQRKLSQLSPEQQRLAEQLRNMKVNNVSVSNGSSLKVSVTEKKSKCVRLREQLETLERETASKLNTMDQNNTDLQELKESYRRQTAALDELRRVKEEKRRELSRKKEEEEERKRREEERKQEEERRRREEEEAQRRIKMEKERLWQEKLRKDEEERQRRLQEEKEAKQREEEERERLALLQAAKEEAERKRREVEEKKKREEEERKKQAERRRQEEERRKLEEERRQLEEERRKLEEERRMEEKRRKEEEDRRKREEERREEERRREKEEEERRRQRAAVAAVRDAEERRRQEEERKRREEERRRAEEERKRKEEEEERRRAEDVRKKKEEEEKRRAEDAKKKKEEEERRRVEEVKKRKEEASRLSSPAPGGGKVDIQEKLTALLRGLEERKGVQPRSSHHRKSAALTSFRALYPFTARNNEELDFNTDDVIEVDESTEREEGWLYGSRLGLFGWFPESYVERVSDSSSAAKVPLQSQLSSALDAALAAGSKSAFTPTHSPHPAPADTPGQQVVGNLQAQALCSWTAKTDNHLNFNKSDVICVLEQQENWWLGELRGERGWFPKTYVTLLGEDSAADMKTSPPDASDSSDSVQLEEFIALYTYESPEPGDLTFRESDVILVSQREGEWWRGAIGDRVGLFPSNYVKPRDTETSSLSGKKKPEIAQVIKPHTSTCPEQLHLENSQLILILSKNSSGWWLGELQARGKKRQKGWFPSSHVKILGSNSGKSTPAAQAVCQVIAIYDYSAANGDELSFSKGQLIDVYDNNDPDWWRGGVGGVTGLFPTNYVQVTTTECDPSQQWCSDLTSLDSLSVQEKKRQGYIHELIETEERYVEDLQVVLEVFYKPMSESGRLSDSEMNMIFVNWKELLACNSKLNKALSVRKKSAGERMPVSKVGDVLASELSHMQPYIRFCSCQINGAAVLQSRVDNEPNFKEFLKKIATDYRCKGMPLSSFLLKPMQRITRYPLHIKNILESTAEGHADRGPLKEALERAEELCQQVNEGVREKENSDRLEWIQNHVQCDASENLVFNSLTNCLGPRKLLHSGKMNKVKSNKELWAFLFNDFLLLTHGSKQFTSSGPDKLFSNKNNVQLKMYKPPVLLNEVLVKLPDPSSDEPVFHISHIDRVYVLKTDNINERTAWVQKIKAASEEFLETEKKKRDKAYQARSVKSSGIGRLLVTILEATELKAAKPNGKSNPYCEVTMGAQIFTSRTLNDTTNPKWNFTCQFHIKDLYQDVLSITVLERGQFSPDEFLGRTEVPVATIKKELENKGPVTRRLLLHEVPTGEVWVRLDLQLFANK